MAVEVEGTGISSELRESAKVMAIRILRAWRARQGLEPGIGTVEISWEAEADIG